MAAEKTIKWPFTQDIHAQMDVLKASRKWHFLADCTKIGHFLADCTHSKNGFHQLLVRSQRSTEASSVCHKRDLSGKFHLGSIPKMAFRGRDGHLMPCVTKRASLSDLRS
jgi:hypothetical protein